MKRLLTTSVAAASIAGGLVLAAGPADAAFYAKIIDHYGEAATSTLDNVQKGIDGGVNAGTNWGEGFCLLNDQAIASNYLLDRRLSSSILIIDLIILVLK